MRPGRARRETDSRGGTRRFLDANLQCALASVPGLLIRSAIRWPESHRRPPRLPPLPSRHAPARCALPRRMLATIAASEPYSRSPAGTSCPIRCAIVRPTNDLREVPASSGNPSRCNWPKLASKRIVLLEILAEAEAGIEHDALASHTRFEGHLHPIGQVVLNLGRQYRRALSRLRHSVGRPRVCIITTPHQLGAGRSHGGVPLKGADVVDDLRARSSPLLARPPICRCQPTAPHPAAALQNAFQHRHDAVAALPSALTDGFGPRLAGRTVPGRVDSPPMSRMSAPSSSSRSACSTARSGRRNAPPSENESGVTLTTPMTAYAFRAPELGTAAASDNEAHGRLYWRGCGAADSKAGFAGRTDIAGN